MAATNNMTGLSVIIARGGSKGIPKNLANVVGRPLITHIIDSALTGSESVILPAPSGHLTKVVD